MHFAAFQQAMIPILVGRGAVRRSKSMAFRRQFAARSRAGRLRKA